MAYDISDDALYATHEIGDKRMTVRIGTVRRSRGGYSFTRMAQRFGHIALGDDVTYWGATKAELIANLNANKPWNAPS